MGWLELLPLMRRLLPMLSQLTPMLESMLAGRMGARAETERISTAVAATTQSHSALLALLDQQQVQLAQVSNDLQQLRASNDARLSSSVELHRQVADLTSLLRTALVTGGVLLLACLCMLIVLLVRHR